MTGGWAYAGGQHSRLHYFPGPMARSACRSVRLHRAAELVPGRELNSPLCAPRCVMCVRTRGGAT